MPTAVLPIVGGRVEFFDSGLSLEDVALRVNYGDVVKVEPKAGTSEKRFAALQEQSKAWQDENWARPGESRAAEERRAAEEAALKLADDRGEAETAPRGMMVTEAISVAAGQEITGGQPERAVETDEKPANPDSKEGAEKAPRREAR